MVRDEVVDRRGYKLLKRSGWEWQATRMTVPDRVGRLWLVLAVATRYVLAVDREADKAEFAAATVPEPAVRPVPSATVRRPAQGRRDRAVVVRRRGRPPPTSRGGGGPGDTSPSATVAADRETPARVPRWRRTGTKHRLVSVFRQGLAVLLSIMIAGHALPKPSWKPEAWLEIRCEIKPPPQQPPTPIPKNPSL